MLAAFPDWPLTFRRTFFFPLRSSSLATARLALGSGHRLHPRGESRSARDPRFPRLGLGQCAGAVPPAARRSRMGPARWRMPGCAGCPRVGLWGWGGTCKEGIASPAVGWAQDQSRYRASAHLSAPVCSTQDRGPATQVDSSLRFLWSVYSPVTY